MTEQNRVASGVPTGGQFAAHARSDDTIDLAAAFRASSVAAIEAEQYAQRLAAKVLAQKILAEQPTATHFVVSEGEEGGYWNSGGTVFAQDEEIGESDELACGDDLFEFIQLPFTKPYDPNDIGVPARGYEWLELTPQTFHDFAEAKVDLHAAASQVLTIHDYVGQTVTLDFDDDDAATGVDGENGVVVAVEDGKLIVDVDGFRVRAAQHETTLVGND